MEQKQPIPKKFRVKQSGVRAKGKRFEREIASEYRRLGLDETAQPMPMSGGMAWHKGDILKKYDHEFVDECKNAETVKIWKWWAQTESQITGLEKPVLHIRRGSQDSISIVRTSDYFQLRLELKQLREQLEGASNGRST